MVCQFVHKRPFNWHMLKLKQWFSRSPFQSFISRDYFFCVVALICFLRHFLLHSLVTSFKLDYLSFTQRISIKNHAYYACSTHTYVKTHTYKRAHIQTSTHTNRHILTSTHTNRHILTSTHTNRHILTSTY